MGGGVWYDRQAADEKDQNGMSCHFRHWPITTLAVELSSQQIKTLGVGVWVVLGKDRAVDRDRFLLCLRPSSFFVCSGLLISSSSSSPPLSLSESTESFHVPLLAQVRASFCPEHPCFLPWLSGTSFLRIGGTMSPYAGLSRHLGWRVGWEVRALGSTCKSPKWCELPFEMLAHHVSGSRFEFLASKDMGV